jgi:hypothetical protein
MLSKKMVIKLVLLVALPQIVFANAYIGTGIGVSDFFDRQLITAPAAQTFTPVTHDYSGLGFLGSVHGGYCFSYNRFNLGLEMFYTGANNQIGVDDVSTTGGSNTTMRISSRYGYGIRALPGYEIAPNVIGYAIIGSTRGVFRQIDNGANAILSSNFGVYGYQLGLGSAVALLKNLEARLDFIYTEYPNHNSIGSLIQADNPQATYHDSLKTFNGVLSLSYKFNW